MPIEVEISLVCVTFGSHTTVPCNKHFSGYVKIELHWSIVAYKSVVQ